MTTNKGKSSSQKRMINDAGENNFFSLFYTKREKWINFENEKHLKIFPAVLRNIF